jgi:magnesium-transporting ATPase (P-type)
MQLLSLIKEGRLRFINAQQAIFYFIFMCITAQAASMLSNAALLPPPLSVAHALALTSLTITPLSLCLLSTPALEDMCKRMPLKRSDVQGRVRRQVALNSARFFITIPVIVVVWGM